MWWILLACRDPDTGAAVERAVLEPVVERSQDVETVWYARWLLEEEGRSWVEFGPDEAYGYRTAVTEGRFAEVAVIGVPAASEWHWRAVSEVGGEVLASDDQTIQTGAAPPRSPVFTPTIQEEGAYQPGWITVPAIAPGIVFVLNTDGQPVWWVERDPNELLAQAFVSRDGQSIYYNLASVQREPLQSRIVRERLDLTERVVIATPGAHHDFVELPSGQIAYIEAEIREVEGVGPVVGDNVILIEANGGGKRLLWSAWERVPYASQGPDSGTYPQGYDWTHCNGLRHDDERGQLLLSCYNLSTVFGIDAVEGGELWRVGKLEGSLTLTTPEDGAFRFQHSPSRTPEGTLLVFNNRDRSDDPLYSEVAEYSVDEEAGTWARVWSYDAGRSLFTYAMGDAQRLTDGNTFTIWGNACAMREVTPTGQNVLQLDGSAGCATGFGKKIYQINGVERVEAPGGEM